MPLSEHVYCVAVAFKMTEQSNKSASNVVFKLECSSAETVQMIQNTAVMANW